MFRKLLFSTAAATLALNAGAQITITSSDMPVLGDTLRFSSVERSTNMNLGNTGANIVWDYSALRPESQDVDRYVTVTGAGYAQGSISPAAYGYRITDTLAFSGSPASLTDVYTFFSNNATRYAAVGFAAKVNGSFPITAAYTDEDEWLNFPLTFGRYDSTTFRFSAAVPFVGSVRMQGYRKTRVDGWGTIVTPYLTTPTQVLRIRSEVMEIDSVILPTNTYVFPRNLVEYQWLAKNLRYPALLVSAEIIGGQEVPTNIRYRDNYRTTLGVGRTQQQQELSQLQVYPNPATGNVRVTIPAGWNVYQTALYDVTGHMLSMTANTDVIATEGLPAGQYTVIVRSGGTYGVAQFVK